MLQVGFSRVSDYMFYSIVCRVLYYLYYTITNQHGSQLFFKYHFFTCKLRQQNTSTNKFTKGTSYAFPLEEPRAYREIPEPIMEPPDEQLRTMTNATGIIFDLNLV